MWEDETEPTPTKPGRRLELRGALGRKYGINLLMLYQLIGKMREADGGGGATSKCSKVASWISFWISFSATNDPETAAHISKRCGDTTVEVDQLSQSSQMSASSRTRSKQLARRPLIRPHEAAHATYEQIIFTAGNPPLRCGRAVLFRRADIQDCVGENRFYRKQGSGT